MATWMSCDLWEDADAVFLITGMEENERFAKELAQAQMKVTPERFDGVFPIVYQKMLYTAPFEKFHGLRQLASQIRDATGLRACYRGIVGLDLTDWFGHEQEEYLKITFKFLHDHRQMWKLLFTVRKRRRFQDSTNDDHSSTIPASGLPGAVSFPRSGTFGKISCRAVGACPFHLQTISGKTDSDPCCTQLRLDRSDFDRYLCKSGQGQQYDCPQLYPCAGQFAVYS